MDLTKTILGDIREAVGFSYSEPSTFDTELLMHINTAVAKLDQNGIGNTLIVDDTTTWQDLQNPTQTVGNKFFVMIPLFIAISTKIIFDPPPPSSVEYHSRNADEILWRLKLAYEEPYVAPTTVE